MGIHDIPRDMQAPISWDRIWTFPFSSNQMPLVAWDSKNHIIGIEIRRMDDNGAMETAFLMIGQADWDRLGRVVPDCVEHFIRNDLTNEG